jgi:hypothetical protein
MVLRTQFKQYEERVRDSFFFSFYFRKEVSIFIRRLTGFIESVVNALLTSGLDSLLWLKTGTNGEVL